MMRRASLLAGCGPLLVASGLGLSGCGAGDLHPFATGGGEPVGESSQTAAIMEDEDAGQDAGGAASTGTGTAGGEPADPAVLPRGLVYVRCPRTLAPLELEGDVIEADGTTVHMTRTLGYSDVYDRLPRATAFDGFVAPCDLVLRTDDGDESVLFDCATTSTATRTCAAITPAVSHDGRFVAFSVWSGTIVHDEMRTSPLLFDPEASGGDQRWYDLPNPLLSAGDAELHVVDLATGEDVVLPHDDDTLDTDPSFLSDGRIVFASTRAGDQGVAVNVESDPWNTSMEATVAQLHTIDLDGRNRRRIGVHGLAGERAPIQLRDGRIAFVSRQLMGMLPYRYDNGSPGSAGAIGGSYHLYAVDPDGARLTPMFGQHTYTSGSADHTHVTSQGITQASDGTIWVGEASGPFGAGRIYAFAPRDDGREGATPGEVEVGDMLRPEDLENLVPWAARSGLFASPTPPPAVMLDGYADPLVYRGFVRDPEALPDGAMLASWAKGACGDIAVADEELFGPDPPPLTSGSGAFTAMNALDLLGLDTPGCDAGIVRLPGGRSDHPSDLEIVVDTLEFHEIMPRRVGPWADVHGVDAPDVIPPAEARAEPSEHLEAGTPFALLGAASLLLRQTRSVDGHPFGGIVQWALQGTDTSDYGDDEICGLRLLAVQPNRPDEPDPSRVPAGLRTLVLAEVPARKVDDEGETVLDPTGVPDTSVRLRVPADVPVLVQGIDCLGRTLSTSQTPMSLRPGEDLRCDGCHVRSGPGLPFADTAAARPDHAILLASAGEVQLLAGGEGADVDTRTIPGWGRAYEFQRDVWPILQARCISCHGGAAPAAGLPLDLPGIDTGSTWWRLVADRGQALVPESQAIPAGPLRKPQLSRYVRFMSARGSLLYWKAADARTDGRTDDAFGDDAPGGQADVDFGASHPTEMTDEELGVLARWIDTGAAAGDGAFADALAPTLQAVVAPGDPARLVVGTVDIGSGIDPDSLEVCSLAATGSCSTIDAPPAAEAGVVTVELPESTSELELRIRVRDRAGNETVLERTFAADEGPSGTGTGGMGAGGETGDGATEGSGTASSGDAREEDGDAAGCGCTGAPAPSSARWFALVAIAAGLRRRGPARSPGAP